MLWCKREKVGDLEAARLVDEAQLCLEHRVDGRLVLRVEAEQCLAKARELVDRVLATVGR